MKYADVKRNRSSLLKQYVQVRDFFQAPCYPYHHFFYSIIIVAWIYLQQDDSSKQQTGLKSYSRFLDVSTPDTPYHNLTEGLTHRL